MKRPIKITKQQREIFVKEYAQASKELINDLLDYPQYLVEVLNKNGLSQKYDDDFFRELAIDAIIHHTQKYIDDLKGQHDLLKHGRSIIRNINQGDSEL